MEGLATIRKRKGYTQQGLADLLGIQRATLAMWEILLSWPPAEILPKIADILGCTIEDLYHKPEEEETP